MESCFKHRGAESFLYQYQPDLSRYSYGICYGSNHDDYDVQNVSEQKKKQLHNDN